jgi:hypothetical protein
MPVIAKRSGLFMDTKIFGNSFTRYAGKTLKTKAKKGAFKAGSMIIADCLKEEPKVPRLISDLQASHVVKPDPNPLKLQVIIGFNKEYAAKMHEMPDKTWNPKEGKQTIWTLPGSGPKYMTTKLVRYKDKYIAFIAMLLRTGQV